ncbi:hypothetical protein FA95DRAFT_1604634 [Auriscalpium vulgare]|uniref:Uncharacterized protein n=1 Tax=Auriscalpium vulgare TaxID=40419 RepID=A0ACB8RZ36_9AGAM|nr:hypothetical protein FA95DRAFT_1604634 [Auriscalpium vulgare]
MPQRLPGRRDTWSIAKNALTEALEIAELTVDGLPVPGAKLAFSGVLRIIRGLDKSAGNAEMLDKVRDQITQLNYILAQKTALDDTEELTTDVQDLKRDLEDSTRSWEGRPRRSRLSRYLSATDDEAELLRVLEVIRLAVERFHIRLQIGVRQAVARLEEQAKKEAAAASLAREQAEAAQKAAEKAQQRSFLAQTLPYAADAHYASVRGRERSPCLEGTRTDVLQEIKAWLQNDDPGAKPMFWLNGMAGMGKTSIAQTVALMAEGLDFAIGSFFFTRELNQLADATLVFPTICRQLAEGDDAFLSSAWEALHKNSGYGSQSPAVQCSKLVTGPMSCMDSSRNVVLIVDALDESASEDRAADVLANLCNLAADTSITAHVRIFITSRPEPHIRTVLEDRPDIQRFNLHDINTDSVAADMRLYLSEELSRIPRLLSMTISGEWPSPEDVLFLADRSKELFIYAATSIKFIGDTYARNPQKQIAIIRGLRASSKNPYAQLDALYMQIFASAFPLGATDEEDIETARIVVGSMLLMRRRIPMQSLAIFIGVDRQTLDNTLYRMHSIIFTPSVEDPDDGPTFYHVSVREFITSPTRCGDGRFVIEEWSHEQRLALRCVAIMNTPRASFAEESNHRFWKLVLTYSVNEWTFHFERATRELVPSDVMLLDTLYKAATDFDLEIFSDTLLDAEEHDIHLHFVTANKMFQMLRVGLLQGVLKSQDVPSANLVFGTIFSIVRLAQEDGNPLNSPQNLAEDLTLLREVRTRHTRSHEHSPGDQAGMTYAVREVPKLLLILILKQARPFGQWTDEKRSTIYKTVTSVAAAFREPPA